MFYPAIRCGVVGVIPELRWFRRGLELRGAPRVLDRSVERRPGQVEASPGYLRLQPGEQAQALRVALEPAAASGEQRQGQLSVVPERRVSQVVGQARGVHQVRVTPELGPELPPDLRALQRVGEPGPGKSPAPISTTWVFAASLRSAEECSTRARSRTKGLRRCSAGGSSFLGSAAQRAVAWAS